MQRKCVQSSYAPVWVEKIKRYLKIKKVETYFLSVSQRVVLLDFSVLLVKWGLKEKKRLEEKVSVMMEKCHHSPPVNWPHINY